MRRINISAWAIRAPIPSVVLFIILILLGVFSFQQLPVERFPNIDVPTISVVIAQPGASPSELETQVTKHVEDALAALSGVKHVVSTITDGTSITTVQFHLGINTDRALNDVKDAVTRIRGDLPRTIEAPVTQRVDIAGLPILTYAASAKDMSLEELSWFIDDTVKREIQSVRGVGEVRRVGGVTREIRVALKFERLLALGITAGEVSRQLRATNVDVSGGKSEIGGSEQTIRALASAENVETLASMPIVLQGGRKIRLNEIASVTDSYEEPKYFARYNGKEVVGFAISRAKGASDVVVSQLVDAKLAQIAKEHPNVKLENVDDTVAYTKGNYISTMHTLLEGAALAVFIVFLFLRDWRATLMAAIALPLSIFPAFWAMQALGFSLNLVTLLALTIVTGILVDDAIVEIENIVRHMRMGKSAYRAALEAADEIGLAVIAITTTIIAVFVPVSFMGGIAGQYFKQFGITVAAAVFFSLLVARLITPMLAAYFMHHDQSEEPSEDGRLMRAYSRLIRWSVEHRIKTVLVGLVIFVLSIASAQLLPQDFLPVEDQSRILVATELPPGARLEDMKATSDAAVQKIRKHPEVKSVFVDGGRILGFAGGGDEVRRASFVVTLVDKTERERTQRQLENAITRDLATIPDLRSWIMNENGQRILMLNITGKDSAAVSAAAPDIVKEMQRIPELRNVQAISALDRPEIRFRPRSEVAADLGVSTEALSETIRIATIGDITANLAKFNVGDRQIPIRVQLEDGSRGNRHMLEALKVPTANGTTVPLITVASIETGMGPSSIDRYDRHRRIVVGTDLGSGVALGKAMEKTLNLPIVKEKAKMGVELKETGDAEVMGEVFVSFGQAMAAGLMLVFAVLVLLFGSFLQPVTILFSLPLSLGGVVFALHITNRPFSFPVVIGVLMLMGVVTKNAIMLVDFAIEAIARGIERHEAIIDAGRKRARPIIMTTIAMAGGMLPSALALGAGGEFRAPMAIAVIGGLLLATVLSLVFVPAVFTLMDDLGLLVWRIFSRFVGPMDDPEDEVKLLPKAEPYPEEVAKAAE
ncbi:MAG: efflux RND transporter permease subunit [Alphaproteobacteria bacterium]